MLEACKSANEGCFLKMKYVPPVLAGAISYMSWTGPEWAGLATGITLLWMIAGDRRLVSVTILAYYLVGQRNIPQVFIDFYQSWYAYPLGYAAWVASGVLLTAPWVVMWKPSMDVKSVAIRLSAILLAITIPPLGVISAVNPLLASASLLAGGGWLSVGFGLCLLISIPIFWLKKYYLALLSAAITIVTLITLDTGSNPSQPEGWHVMNTTWGKAPKQATKAEFDRWVEISLSAEDQFNQGKAVVIFPEGIAGDSGDYAETFIGAYLAPSFKQGKVLIVGSLVVHWDTNEESFNIASIFSENGVSRYIARQQIPIAAWKPWSIGGASNHWLNRSVFEIDGKKVAFNICYEDFLLGLSLLSLSQERPDVIVSIANAGWSETLSHTRIQDHHIELISKVIGAKLVRAINKPKAT